MPATPGRGVGRDLDDQLDATRDFLPGRGHLAVPGADRTAGGVQVFWHKGRDVNLFETRSHCLVPIVLGSVDAGQVIVEKLVYSGPHDHTLCIADARITRPALPNRRCALFYHIAPPGVGSVGDDSPQHVTVPQVAQAIDQARRPGIAGVVVIAVLLGDALDEAVEDALFGRMGNDVDRQRERRRIKHEVVVIKTVFTTGREYLLG